MGYHRAGFEVVGVDINPQPNYPFEFYQGDALELAVHMVNEWSPGFDAIHASPPCQAYSRLNRVNRRQYPDLVGPVRDLLNAIGLPYVIENVPEAPLGSPIILCGSMFELDVRRHRGFEANWPLAPHHWPCRHRIWDRRFRSLDKRQKVMAQAVGVHGHLNYSGEREIREQAMGIDWMSTDELCEAIPPAYCEFLGAQLLAHLEAVA